MGERKKKREGGLVAWCGGRVRVGRKSKQIRRKKRKRERVACKSVIRRRKKAKAWCMQRNLEQRSELEGEGDIRESANQRKRERERKDQERVSFCIVAWRRDGRRVVGGADSVPSGSGVCVFYV